MPAKPSATSQHDPSESPASGDEAVATVVARGLAAHPRRLPPWLFYDAAGSALYEAITELPEYYLTRAEHAIFAQHGAALMETAAAGERATIIDIGAGTAAKTAQLVRALAAQQGPTRFVAVDISPSALDLARARFQDIERVVTVDAWAVTHAEMFERLPTIAGRKVALFVGSSIGNFEDDDAEAWLGRLRGGLDAGDALVLGTDLRKDPELMVRAYDDAAGVTAAFNRNLLTRLNRELGGDFVTERFRHVAVWNPAASRIEMHLESVGDQLVRLARLGLSFRFADGERIHTESSVKYDDARVVRLLDAGGFRRERVVTDQAEQFAVHLARAV